MMRWRRLLLLGLFGRAVAAAASPDPEALFVIVADQHSAYDRTAQLVARIEQLKADNASVPFAILVDGDAFELGNVVAKRSGGAIDFAMFAELARIAPTIVNLGNHEPEFDGLAATVQRLRATGVTVISNAVDRATRVPFAPASTHLKLGTHDAVVVGIATDDLATYRAPVRPTLELAPPVDWANSQLPAFFTNAELPIILSHAGLNADRAILPLVPNGTLFAGAHDHLRLVHHQGRTVYFHSGSWNEFASVARLQRTADGLAWSVEQIAIEAGAPGNSPMSALIQTTLAANLTDSDRQSVGHLARALGPTDAAQFIVRAVRTTLKVDAAFVGRTTFGAGLPAGDVSRYAFDACIRFDGPLCTGEIDGKTLLALLHRANQGPVTPFAERTGEMLVADARADISPEGVYQITVTDWIARNPKKYLGVENIQLTPRPEWRLKAIGEAALK